MPNSVKEIDCSTAEDFLQILDRGNDLWNGAIQFWAFRGHSSDDYKLIPSALRKIPKAAELGYTFAPKKGVQTTNQKQIDVEFERIHEFYWSIDAQGLEIPGDSNLLRTPAGWRALQDRIQKTGWPIDDLHPLLAIAQHYGVPTRLLDWSDNPLVAAFFAATGSVNKEMLDDKFLSVWALNLDWIINEAFPDGDDFPDGSKMSVYVVTAPRATNPNLHAQGGVFTTERIIIEEFTRTVSDSSVDTLVEEKWNFLKCDKPVMVHLKLPVSEAKKLLRLLNQEHINSATLFPGYKGVADSLKERTFWDKPDRVNYWLRNKLSK